MIEVPVGVDEVFDRIAAKAVDGFQDAWAGGGNASIDEERAVFAGQDGDIPARSLDDGDLATQLVDRDRHSRCGIADRVDNVPCLDKSLRGRQPAAFRAEAGGDGATYAKAPS